MANKMLKQETPLRLGRLDKNVVVVCKRIRDASRYTSKKYRSSFYS